VRVGAVVCCISAVGFALIAGVHGTICVDGLTVAVVLEALGTVRAVFLQTAAGLGTDAHAVALLYVLDVFANFDGFADNFVANDAS
jgi:hypothetical protein